MLQCQMEREVPSDAECWEVERSVVGAAVTVVLVVAILTIAQQLELGEVDCEVAFVPDENDREALGYQM